jgi:acid stress-induced BolA-like protein IbaG/YrbA
MTAAELLQGLKARGATVAANGDRLKLAAPPGVLSPRVLDFAAQHKTELLALLQSDPLTPDAVPPADGLIRRGALIMPTRETLPAYRAHFDAKAVCELPQTDPQTERIRRLAATVTAAELLAAHRTIKPLLKAQLNQTDLHELALRWHTPQSARNRSQATKRDRRANSTRAPFISLKNRQKETANEYRNFCNPRNPETA